MTVAEMLEQSLLGRITVLAGLKGLLRMISRASLFDPVIKPESGSLISVPNGLLSLNEAQALAILAQFCGLGVSAILLAGDAERPSPEVLAAADADRIPLIILHELPPEAAVAVVTNCLLRREVMLLRRSEHASKKIMEVALSGGLLREILATLASLIKCPVALTDPEGRVAEVHPGPLDISLQPLVGSILPGLENLGRARNRYKAPGVHNPLETVASVTIPIISNRHMFGYVIIWTNQTLAEQEMVVVDRTTAILGLQLLNEHTMRHQARTYRNEFFQAWLNGDMETDGEVKRRAAAFGWSLVNQYYAIVLPTNGGLLPSGRVGIPYEVDGPAPWELFEALAAMVKESMSGILIAERGDQVILIVPGAPDSPTSVQLRDSSALMRDLTNDLARRLNWVPAAMGAGRITPSLVALKASLQQARVALEIGLREGQVGQSLNFDELGVHRILYRLRDDPELQSYVDESLGPMRRYDQEHSTDLLHTLTVYLDCNCNVREAAVRLVTHHNTVHYRLRRIEEISGHDLKDPNTRLTLQLCLKAIRLIS